jgi:hypothetical protein
VRTARRGLSVRYATRKTERRVSTAGVDGALLAGFVSYFSWYLARRRGPRASCFALPPMESRWYLSVFCRTTSVAKQSDPVLVAVVWICEVRPFLSTSPVSSNYTDQLAHKRLRLDGAPSQIEWWTEFIGLNQFCMKICNPAGTNEAGYRQHILNRISLAYNYPSKYTIADGAQDGEFEVCDWDLMTVPGIYVVISVTSTYAQPPESLGAISNIPYLPSPVVSSNCATTT